MFSSNASCSDVEIEIWTQHHWVSRRILRCPFFCPPRLGTLEILWVYCRANMAFFLPIACSYAELFARSSLPSLWMSEARVFCFCVCRSSTKDPQTSTRHHSYPFWYIHASVLSSSVLNTRLTVVCTRRAIFQLLQNKFMPWIFLQFAM